MKKIILVGLILLVAGCASITPGEFFKQKGNPDLSLDGLVVLKIWGTTNGNIFSGGWKESNYMQVFFKEVGGQRYTWTTTTKKRHSVVKLPEGTWHIHAVSPGAVLFGLPGSEFDHSMGLPFKPFTVTAGEILYLGDVVLDGVKHEKTIYVHEASLTRLVDGFDEAKFAVKQDSAERILGYPGMRKQLLEYR